MFGSEILDVAIGLVLVFLLVSLVLTAVQEVIEAWLRSRAGDLNRALFELLQNDADLVAKFHNHPLIFALHRAGVVTQPAGSTVTPDRRGDSYQAPTRAERSRLPSYIPREAFAAALIDLLGTGETRNENLLKAYDSLNRLSGGNVARIRAEIEGWYDGAMDRASGWYKRRTQKILFVLGLASAIVLNINAVTIGRYLATDQDARALVAAYGERVIKEGQPTEEAISDLQQSLQNDVGLPIGWSEASLAAIERGYPTNDQRSPVPDIFAGLALLLGYIVVAFAAMLGAPFWFDVLNRIMVIRSTVKPKEKSPDEPSEEGGTDKQRQLGAAGGVGVVNGAQKAAGAGGGGGGLAGMPGAAAEAPSPIADAEDEEELDGCLSDDDLPEEDVTKDIDLPPTTGGVETR